jgi:HlyD family secretion protein
MTSGPPVNTASGGSADSDPSALVSRRSRLRNLFRRATQADPTASGAANSPASDDPLLSAEPPPAPPPGPEQQPRGQRRRRTTLPRSTRGWSRGIVWTLIGFTTFSVVYSLLARIDSSVAAPGKLRPVGGLTTVSAPFASLVERVLVRDGQLVRPGQPLLRLRAKPLRDQLAMSERIHRAWTQQLAILAIQLDVPSDLPRDPLVRRELNNARLELRLRRQAAEQELARSIINLNQQQSDLQGLTRRLAINESIRKRMVRLVRQGAVSHLELDRQDERQTDLIATLRRTSQERDSARHRVEESRLRLRQILAADRKQVFNEYHNARQQWFESKARLLDLRDRINLSELRAASEGRIFDLSVKVGELATPATPVMRIIPQRGFQAELTVSNRDIGFVHVGMPVEVRVDSFPFTEYGALKGKVSSMAADVLTPDPEHPRPYFSVSVSLDSNQLKRNGITYPLISGMAVNAMINLGKRPVISLVSDRLGELVDSPRSIR